MPSAARSPQPAGPAGAHELQDIPAGHAALVGQGQVLDGDWHRPADRRTVFKSTGYAALDVAAAYEAATDQGIGSWIGF